MAFFNIGEEDGLFGHSCGLGLPLTPVVMRVLCGWFPVGEWDADVGAYQVDHVHHVPDVPEAVCLADDQFDLVVGRLDPRVAHAQADCVQDVFLVAFDLGVQFPERRDPAVARPPQPVFQVRLGLVGVGRFQQEPKGFLQPVRPVQFRGLPPGSCRAGRAGRRSGSPGPCPARRRSP